MIYSLSIERSAAVRLHTFYNACLCECSTEHNTVIMFVSIIWHIHSALAGGMNVCVCVCVWCDGRLDTKSCAKHTHTHRNTHKYTDTLVEPWAQVHLLLLLSLHSTHTPFLFLFCCCYCLRHGHVLAIYIYI